MSYAYTEKQPQRCVSLILPPADFETKHCAGVEAIVLAQNQSSLFTASRDSTCRRWRLSTTPPTPDALYQGHTDWVHDVVLMENDSILMTASSDRTIRAWSATSPHPTCLQVLQGHGDHVQCLAAAKNRPLLASAGLMSDVCLWDITAVKPLVTLPLPPSSSSSQWARMQSVESLRLAPTTTLPLSSITSTYALAMDPTASLVVCGTSDGSLSLLDPRIRSDRGALIASLTGHASNIHAILLDDASQFIITGSSDKTIRVWDVKQRRCLQTHHATEDSVYALAMDKQSSSSSSSSSTLYAGGRDGTVRRINLLTKAWDILCEGEHPVRSLALDAQRGGLWVGTTSSDICCYDLRAAERTASTRYGASSGMSMNNMSSPSPKTPSPLLARLLSAQQASTSASSLHASTSTMNTTPLVASSPGSAPDFPVGSPPHRSLLARISSQRHSKGTFLEGNGTLALMAQPLVSLPSLVIKGTPPIIQAAILEDRRHVLCRTLHRHVSQWDITTASLVHAYGAVDFDATLSQLFTPDVVPSWFTIDTRCGFLACRLDPATCFAAEVYAADLLVRHGADDAKFNYGDQVLEGLFSIWRERAAPGKSELVSASGSPMRPALDSSGVMSPGGIQLMDDSCIQQDAMMMDVVSSVSRDSTPKKTPLLATTAPLSSSSSSMRSPFQFALVPPPRPWVQCNIDGGRSWRLAMDQFDGSEPIGPMVPYWVARAVLYGEFPLTFMAKFPSINQTKLTFELQPADGSGLPILSQPSLSAPKILKMSKVVNYAVSKLNEQGVMVVPGPPPEEGGGGEMPVRVKQLELLCHGRAVPYCYTLAAVRKYFMRGGDVMFTFRIRDARNPAPVAWIKGGGGER